MFKVAVAAALIILLPSQVIAQAPSGTPTSGSSVSQSVRPGLVFGLDDGTP